jgi:hypothetical protein
MLTDYDRKLKINPENADSIDYWFKVEGYTGDALGWLKVSEGHGNRTEVCMYNEDMDPLDMNVSEKGDWQNINNYAVALVWKHFAVKL